ncbi:MAG: hypothetical protein LIP06_14495 [Tannerellaceae bacterium]|nr:hypothetical protein [Tannerellaceae bacterium]
MVIETKNISSGDFQANMEQATILIRKIYDSIYNEKNSVNKLQNSVIGYSSVEDLEAILSPAFFSDLKNYFEQMEPVGFEEKMAEYRKTLKPQKSLITWRNSFLPLLL